MSSTKILISLTFLYIITISAGVASERKNTKKSIHLGEKELIYTDENIPIRYDGSLSTLRKDANLMYFFHSYGCRIDKLNKNTKSSHKCFLGYEKEPLKEKVFDAIEEDFLDYNGFYQDTFQEGIWILGMYKRKNGDLLAITHSEVNYYKDHMKFLYTIGLAYSKDNGKSWIYCGEIIKPSLRMQNTGGGAYIIKGSDIYVYYNDSEFVNDSVSRRGRARDSRVCVAKANLKEVLSDAQNGEVGTWYKYRDGKWDVRGLSGIAGSNIIPTNYGGEDCHSDATYCNALGKYLLTIQASKANNLILLSSKDGVNWTFEKEIDQAENVIMPYSCFVDFDGPKDDCSEVDDSFYIYYPHKSRVDHDHDVMYRRKISIE
jgi:hypothetical protein